MAHDGTGNLWDEASPANSEAVSNGALEIRDLRKGLNLRFTKEHKALTTGLAGGEHINGSANAYFQDTFPTKRPNGLSNLSDTDAGRLLVRSDLHELYYRDGNSWQKLRFNNPDQLQDGLMGANYCVIADQKADGVAGGASTNTFTARALNTKQVDFLYTLEGGTPVNFVDVSVDTFTLQPGYYRIRASAPGFNCDSHQCRLRRMTPTEGTVNTGTVAYAGDNNVTRSEVVAQFSIAAESTYQIQHKAAAVQATNGFGLPGSMGVVEIYTVVEIWRLSSI